MNFNILGKGSDTLFFQEIETEAFFIWSRDPVKTVYDTAGNFRQGRKFNFFPNIRKQNTFQMGDESYTFYEGEEYEQLTMEDSIAYTEFEELQKIHERIDENLYFDGPIFQEQKYFNRLLQYVKESHILPREMKDEFTDTVEYLTSHFTLLRFEISGRNVKVSQEGHLILLDCFFLDPIYKRDLQFPPFYSLNQ